LIIWIDRTKDRFLSDHVVGGVAILPTVMGLDLLVRATACLLTDHTQLHMHDVVVGPAVFVETGSRTLRVAADATSAESWCSNLTSPWSVESHLRATLRVASGGRSRCTSPSAVAMGSGIASDLIYPPYFHGPAFQVVGRFQRTDQGFLASMSQTLPELRWSAGRLQLRDALLPAAGFPERPALAEMIPRRPSNEDSWSDAFDGRVVDQDGRVLLDIVGYHCVDLGVPADAKHAATLHRLLQQTEGVPR
jgi:hypothetical protein